jgi:hypothetical protein
MEHRWVDDVSDSELRAHQLGVAKMVRVMVWRKANLKAWLTAYWKAQSWELMLGPQTAR